MNYTINPKDYYLKDEKLGNIDVKGADEVGAISGDILKVELISKKHKII